MVAEAVPASVASDGLWRITWVDDLLDNPLSVAILDAGSLITYSLTADGWNHSTTQAEAEDKRMTLIQDLTRPGRKKETLEIRFVDSETAGSADQVLTEGAEGYFVIRRGTDNATAWTVGDTVDVITAQCGVKRRDAPTENGVDTNSMTIFITAPTSYDATLVA